VKNDKYSVLMSIYINDTIDSVKRSINSVIRQKLPSDDIVIVLDGPVMPEVYSFIVSLDHPIKKLELTDNVGLGDALKAGLSICKHQWVMRMDADDTCDLSRSKKLMCYIKKLTNDNVAAVGSYINERNLDDGSALIVKYPSFFIAQKRIHYFRDPIGHASVMLNKNAVMKVGGYKGCLYFEDTYLWLRLLNDGYSLATVQEALYEARIDDTFYKRRSGFRYLLLELKHLTRFYQEGLISEKSLSMNFVGRILFRLLPRVLVQKIYRSLLRSKIGKENT